MAKKKLNSSDGYLPETSVTAKQYKRLTVEEADNGYVVSMWRGDKDIKVVCKDLKEVGTTIDKIMKK